jgi:homoserine dehydrogenase
MKSIKIAILGCGTVGSGVAKIILDFQKENDQTITIKHILDLYPKKAAEAYNIPLDLFIGGGKDLSAAESGSAIDELIKDPDIDLIVETIGGTSDFLKDIMTKILQSGKHLVTANKAMLAEKGKDIFKAAIENNTLIGYEAAVCGAIPIIKSITESFSGDSITSVSGIFNGTSNYILSQMKENGLTFDTALKQAQEKGYAEADPTLDINGGDAAHKLALLIMLVFGIPDTYGQLHKIGIENITSEDNEIAQEMDCIIKLICYTVQKENNIYAIVCPMFVKNSNPLSKVNNATNAVKLTGTYSGEHTLIGAGAGSLETASSIVADIKFISNHKTSISKTINTKPTQLLDADKCKLPYTIIFETTDKPGITGLITTAMGNENINIDTVGHNRHTESGKTIFPIATMPCTLSDINSAITAIQKTNHDILLSEPKIIPILY